MAKIKVGAPTVFRYHQIRSVLSVSDQENLIDPDFRVPGYLLATSGYMFLEPSQSSTTESEIFEILQFTITKVQLSTKILVK